MMYPAHGIQVGALTSSDVCACYLSAACHDIGHMGRNNNFLINSDDSLAIRYNDKSVLENFHIATTFQITAENDKNIFENFARDDYVSMRGKIVAMVLATDISRHFSDLSKFKNKFATHEISEDGDKIILMEMLMHA
jgi:hypothetical protein